MDEEKLVAVEMVAYRTLMNHFRENGITPVQAKYILNALYMKVLESLIDYSYSKRICYNSPEEEHKDEVHKGTVEEFIKSMNEGPTL